ncbi:hypothetical protein CTI12_AA351040 [Artemisia annua]|uniref:Uncharacterized protein n=1 Tax=Artemisia annua TaxID=35608 RepID=A0A2U1MQX5_ARTAN|nr:hypothetical protein CTI12_AA351040 [Artemisia annua]
MESHPLYGYANDSNPFGDSDLNDKLQKTFKEAVDHYLALEAELEVMHKSNWRLKYLDAPNPWGDSSVNDKRRREMEQEGLRVNEMEELKGNLEVGRESRLEQGNTDMQY